MAYTLDKGHPPTRKGNRPRILNPLACRLWAQACRTVALTTIKIEQLVSCLRFYSRPAQRCNVFSRAGHSGAVLSKCRFGLGMRSNTVPWDTLTSTVGFAYGRQESGTRQRLGPYVLKMELASATETRKHVCTFL